jgi:hypothetical protein
VTGQNTKARYLAGFFFDAAGFFLAGAGFGFTKGS